MNAQDFLDKIGDFARKDMKKSGILASLTIAQAILESGWGKYDCGGNNLFGIKGRYNGQYVLCDTSEYVNGKYIAIKAEFRKYPSWAESLADHSAFICGVKLGDGSLRYAKVIGEKDYKKACQAIKDAGYATSPAYVQSLINIIEQYNLTRFDIEEVKTVTVKNTVKASAPTSKPASAQKQDYISYTVQKGDSWWQIAQNKLGNGNRYMELVKFNGHTTAPAIYPGNIIKIPCGTVTATIKVPAKASAPKPVVKPAAPKKTAQQVAKEVIQGKWGNGLIRRLKLKNAGYNYAAIQAEVNKLC